jgi:hypothetical protein
MVLRLAAVSPLELLLRGSGVARARTRRVCFVCSGGHECGAARSGPALLEGIPMVDLTASTPTKRATEKHTLDLKPPPTPEEPTPPAPPHPNAPPTAQREEESPGEPDPDPSRETRPKPGESEPVRPGENDPGRPGEDPQPSIPDTP